MAMVYEDHVKARIWGMSFDVRIVGAGENENPGKLPEKFLEAALSDSPTVVGVYRRCLDWDRLIESRDAPVPIDAVARLGLLVNMGRRTSAAQVAAAKRCKHLRNELEAVGEADRLWIDLDFTLSDSGASK